ncbi:tetratricopeptide repeat protein [bacterium]|nr:tetratricopeptide repeat protein [bacterium]
MKVFPLYVAAVILLFPCRTGTVSAEENPGALPHDIMTLISEGKYDDARIQLENFRRKYPENPSAILYLARLEKDMNKANALFKEVELLADSSLAAAALFERAELNFASGDIAAAGELYESIVSGYPRSRQYAEALYRLGLIRLVSGAPDEARIHFELCIEQNPVQSLGVLAAAGIMECHVALKEWKTAIESALDVLEHDNDSAVTPRTLEVIALSWHNLGNEENAGHYTERLLKNFPESYQAHSIRARGSSITGDPAMLFMDDDDQPDSLVVSADYGEITADDSVSVDISVDPVDAEFSVQASAFMDKNNAMKLFGRLKDANFDTHLSMKTVADTHFYLVQVGYFNTRDQAEKTADQVTEFTGIKAHVVKLK